MTTESELIRQLADAQRAATPVVDASAAAGLERAAAYRVQTGFFAALGERAGMYKVWTDGKGDAALAPIPASRIVNSGGRLPAAGMAGLEVEIAVELARDLPAGADRATVDAAIGRYVMGIEVCASRYADRSAASFDVGLADSMSAYGYVIGAGDWQHGPDADGREIVLTVAGTQVWRGPAKHGFGGVLNAVYAYAALAAPPYPLRAGTLVTTGSLCGLVPATGPGKAVATLGGHSVDVELV
jgi:2-keto-4-pentenoate hydratase